MTAHENRTTWRTARRPGPRQAGPAQHDSTRTRKRRTRVHALRAGRLRGNKTTTRGTGWWSLLRPRETFEFPAYVYIIEHADGLIAIDTGMNARGWRFPWFTRRITPSPVSEGEHQEIGPQMKAAGLRPEDVRTVILTHLDVDHVGGIPWFPDAEVLVHRAEHEAALSWMGKVRYQPHLWPSDFDPTLYDMDPEPFGPFPESRAVGDHGDLRLVPIPGHSDGQIGVVLRTGGVTLFFSADHVLRQDWFVEDLAAGRLTGLVSGVLWRKRYRELAAETSRRIRKFVETTPTVLLPAHDSDTPRRLAAMETLVL
jgi:N-acyl homoserine lactone hydrolase